MLSYNIYVGINSKDSGNIVSPMSDIKSGRRLKLTMGNVGSDTSWTLKGVVDILGPGIKLYWGVQSIDKGYKNSVFKNDSLVIQESFSSHSGGGYLLIDRNNDNRLEILGAQYKYSVAYNFNNDQYLDLIDYTDNISILNLNPVNTFNVSGAFDNIKTKSLCAGDFDNDGDEDIFLVGNVRNKFTPCFLMKNESGYVEKYFVKGNFPDDQSIKAVDIDNDSDFDIAYGTYILEHESDSVFKVKNVFTFYQSVKNMDWGDFDNDGDLDVCLSGLDITGNYTSSIFLNQGDFNFLRLTNYIRPFNGKGNFKWFDYNNDGLLDLATSAADIWADFSIFINTGKGTFIENQFGGYHATDFGDINADGAIDILGIDNYYISNGVSPNTPPGPVTKLSSKLDKLDVILSWDKGFDQESKNALTYNIRVGTSRNNFDVIPGFSSEDGHLRVPRMGNVQKNLKWKLSNLPFRKYYWSVQAVDQSFLCGPWSPVDSFITSAIHAEFQVDSPRCVYQEKYFNNLTESKDKIIIWKWNFGDESLSFSQNPVHTYQSTGTYVVSLKAITVKNDSDEVKKTIFVDTSLVANFSVMPVCYGTSSHFENLTVVNTPPTFWKWQFANGTMSETKEGPPIIYSETGTATLTVTAKNGCITQVTKPVVVIPNPDGKIRTDNQRIVGQFTFCRGDSVKLSVIDNPNCVYNWIINDTVTIKNANRDLFVEKPGKYMSLVVNPIANCKSSDSVYLSYKEASVKPFIYANTGPNLYYMECNIDTAKTYQWYFNGNKIHGANKYYYVAGKQLGTYMVEIVEQDKECKTKSDAITIPAGATAVGEIGSQPNILIQPNPNDGHFTIFFNGNTGIKRIEIYNLQGVLVYSKKLNGNESQAEVNGAFTTGIYTVLLKNDKQTINKKIVINF